MDASPSVGEPKDAADRVSAASTAEKDGPFTIPGKGPDSYTDNRLPGEWDTKYPPAARRCINQEACVLALFMISFCIFDGILLGMSGQTIVWPINFLSKEADASAIVVKIDIQLLITFFVGCLGGTTFSVKWLVHSAAKSKWHLDRRYWRLFVPLIGGVYACVVLTLFDSGLLGAHGGQSRDAAITAAYAFLIGYFSDGVSGLLSNIANAVFGTLEKK